MKKIIALVACCILAITIITACQANRPSETVDQANRPSETVDQANCAHEWRYASCVELSTCIKCGATRGELAKHFFISGSCIEKQVCAVCGTKGDYKDHSFGRSDCLNPAKCLKCGIVGELGDHVFEGGDCQNQAKCLTCGKLGELGDHAFSEPTCTENGMCAVCGSLDGEPLGHSMLDATCTKPSACVRCEYTDGEPLGHQGQGVCTRCGEVLPITGGGRGDAVITDVNLGDGFYIMHITHDGRRNFIVHSYDATGEKEFLINEIGQYNGVILLNGQSPLMFNIQADGNWTYEIKKLEKTDETRFAGTGDYVTRIFSGMDGTRAWHFRHDGKSNFIVRIYTTDGRNHLINEIGTYDAAQVVTIPAGSNAFFEIAADGYWEIFPE